MAALNKVQLIGNLGRDPEIRSLNNGKQVASLRIATTEKWRDKSSGERREKTEWHSVVVYNENLVSVCDKYLKKGSKLYIEGSLTTREFEKDGVKRYATEIVLQNFRGDIVMLDGKDEGGGGGRSRDDDDDRGSRGNDRGGSRSSDRGNDRGGSSRGGSSSGGNSGRYDDMDDEIPF